MSRRRRGLDDALLLNTLPVLPFLETPSLQAAAGQLFGDLAILLRLGWSPVPIPGTGRPILPPLSGRTILNYEEAAIASNRSHDPLTDSCWAMTANRINFSEEWRPSFFMRSLRRSSIANGEFRLQATAEVAEGCEKLATRRRPHIPHSNRQESL